VVSRQNRRSALNGNKYFSAGRRNAIGADLARNFRVFRESMPRAVEVTTAVV
jgi:hypothetical protein